ncbi:hypothetical protein Ancab_025999, partial [Ancistrocladus abbreviatus]
NSRKLHYGGSGLMELIKSTTEIRPSFEPRSKATPPKASQPTRIHLRIRTYNTKTNMEIVEVAELTSKKEEEQELLQLRKKSSWLHLSS